MDPEPQQGFVPEGSDTKPVDSSIPIENSHSETNNPVSTEPESNLRTTDDATTLTYDEQFPKTSTTSEDITKQIVAQLEYYFSDENLTKDRFLKSKMNHDGEIPLSVFMSFPKLISLLKETKSPETEWMSILSSAAKDSQLLVSSKSGSLIRRIKPFVDKGQIPRDPLTTVIIENLSEKVTQQLLCELMAQGGPVKTIYLSQDNNGLCKGTAYVQFNDEESVDYVLNIFHGIPFFGRKMIVHHYYSPLDTEPGSDVYIGNLRVSDDLFTIYSRFVKYGSISSCNMSTVISKDGHLGAFLVYTKRSMADNAITQLNDTILFDHHISVDYANKSKDYRRRNNIQMVYVRPSSSHSSQRYPPKESSRHQSSRHQSNFSSSPSNYPPPPPPPPPSYPSPSYPAPSYPAPSYPYYSGQEYYSSNAYPPNPYLPYENNDYYQPRRYDKQYKRDGGDYPDYPNDARYNRGNDYPDYPNDARYNRGNDYPSDTRYNRGGDYPRDSRYKRGGDYPDYPDYPGDSHHKRGDYPDDSRYKRRKY